MKPVTIEECVIEITVGLREFGAYSYHDKGASSVIDMYSIVNRFKAMQPSEVAAVLTGVLEGHEDPNPFVSYCVCDLDTMPDAWYDALFDAAPDLARFY